MDYDNDSPISGYSTISDIVYNWIKNAILRSEFKPGERITQETITKRLNVSRTPVRDAFKRLQSEGLLIVKSHFGAIVFELSMDKVSEIYEIRSLLEGLGARYACEMITDENIRELTEINDKLTKHRGDMIELMKYNREFHMTLYGYSKREYLLSHIHSLWDLTEPYRLIYVSHESKVEAAMMEHQNILEALKCRNPDAVFQEITSHLQDVVATLSSHVSETSASGKILL